MEKITIEDKNYPELLKKIKDPPKILYFRGEIKNLKPCFAVVGTRLCSSYGKQVALEIAGDLSKAGVIVVSGLAPGIDTFSHLASVEQGKKTIAVLGTGLDEKSIYPKENIPLARKIVETGGCLFSEYPPGTNGSKITFPKRNRIISGLSLGMLVVEAKERSGSLITARLAFSQKRKVFAVPGQIHSLNSKGTNYLIKKGAILVDKTDDILKELGIKGLKNITSEDKGSQKPEEKIILEALKENALHIDKIIGKTKLGASIVASALSILEIEEKVRNLGGGIYTLRR